MPAEPRQNSGTGALPLWWVTASLLVVAGGFIQILAAYWDLTKHMIGGREGLITTPHLSIMAGSVVCALAAVFVHLRVWRSATLGAGVAKASRSVLICVMIQFGGFLLDEIWHRIFGQDAYLWSPPHMLIVGGCVATILAMAAVNRRLSTSKGSVWMEGALRGIALYTLLFLLSEAEIPNTHAGDSLWNVHLDGVVHPHIPPAVAVLLMAPFCLLLLGMSAGQKDRRRAAQEVLVLAGAYTAARWLTAAILSLTPLAPVAPPLVLLVAVPYAGLVWAGRPGLAAGVFLPLLWGGEWLLGTRYGLGVAGNGFGALAGAMAVGLLCHELGRRWGGRIVIAQNARLRALAHATR